MNERKVTLVIVLLLVSSACSMCGTPSPTPTKQEVEPTTAVPPTPTPSPSPAPSDTPSPVPPPTPTPRPEGWVIVETENFPPPRSDHATAMLPDGRVLLFGGMDENGNALNDTWIFGPVDTAQGMPPGGRTQFGFPVGLGWLSGGIADSLSPVLRMPENKPGQLYRRYLDWSQLVGPYAPESRWGHRIIECRAMLWLFGGTNAEWDWFNDTHVFDGNNWKLWDTNNPPPGRAYYSPFCHDNDLYIAGGVGETGFFKDMWRLNLSDNTWTQLTSAPGNGFSPYAAPFTFVEPSDPDKFTVVFADPHWWELNQGVYPAYNVDTDTWVQWQVEGVGPPGERHGDWSVQIGSEGWSIGGGTWDVQNQKSIPDDNVWVLNLQSHSYSQGEAMPWPVFAGAGAYNPWGDWSIMIWGGFGGLVGENMILNPGNKTLMFFPPEPGPGEEPLFYIPPEGVRLPVTIKVTEDVGGHEGPPCHICMPGELVLEVTPGTEPGTYMIGGPPPWITTTGTLDSDGGYIGTGWGTVAGYPDIAVGFDGTFDEFEGSYILTATYGMGLEGGLPGGHATYYRVERRQVAEEPAAVLWEPVETATDKFETAWATGDVGFLSERLHPWAWCLYGWDTCQDRIYYLVGQVKEVQFKPGEVTVLPSWEHKADGQSEEFKDVVEVNATYFWQDPTTPPSEQVVHFVPLSNGTWGWIADCGEPIHLVNPFACPLCWTYWLLEDDAECVVDDYTVCGPGCKIENKIVEARNEQVWCQDRINRETGENECEARGCECHLFSRGKNDSAQNPDSWVHVAGPRDKQMKDQKRVYECFCVKKEE
jgi:hypothetical protein